MELVLQAGQESLEEHNGDIAMALDEFKEAMSNWCASRMRCWVLQSRVILAWFRVNALRKKKKLLCALVSNKLARALVRVAYTEWFKRSVIKVMRRFKVGGFAAKRLSQVLEVTMVEWYGLMLEGKLKRSEEILEREEEERRREEEEERRRMEEEEERRREAEEMRRKRE